MRTGFSILLCFVGLAPLASFAHAQPVARLIPTTPDFEDDFAAALAVTEADDGTWALIGAPGDNDATGDAGSVFAYYRTEGGEWQLQAQLFAPGEPVFRGGFGSYIALEGRWAVVGETGFEAPGQAYVLRREGEGLASQWEVEAVLVPDSLAHPDHVFGVAMALDISATAEGDGGFVAVVGSGPRGLLDPVPGAAHVFRRASDGKWVEEAVLSAENEDEADRFGARVAADAGRIAVGAFLDERTGGVGSGGAVYTFTYDAGAWSEEERVRPNVAEFFGADVDLEDGWLTVGATGEECPAPDFFVQCGAAYIYERTGARWRQRERLQPTNLTGSALFGSVTTISLPYALVTAPRWNTEGPDDAGAAYLYRLDGSTWSFERLLRAPEPGLLEQFGRTAALSATTVVVGTLETLGAAYAFDLAVLLPSEPDDSQPERFAAAVYPNPSTGSVTLSFQLSQSAEVRVEVFDTLGRAVWRRAVRVEAGPHSMQPEIPGIGLYHVRLRTSTGEAATMKLIRLGR